MTVFGALYVVVLLAWVLTESYIALLRRAKLVGAVSRDKWSFHVFWLLCPAAVTAACLFAWNGNIAAPLNQPSSLLGSIGLLFILTGECFRVAAVKTLGKFFTVDVAVHADHVVVDRGPYALVRHPSYTGVLIASVGLGFTLGGLLSFVLCTVPLLAALLYRIGVEEAALRERLGEAYQNYCLRTKRLIPYVY